MFDNHSHFKVNLKPMQPKKVLGAGSFGRMRSQRRPSAGGYTPSWLRAGAQPAKKCPCLGE